MNFKLLILLKITSFLLLFYFRVQIYKYFICLFIDFTVAIFITILWNIAQKSYYYQTQKKHHKFSYKNYVCGLPLPSEENMLEVLGLEPQMFRTIVYTISGLQPFLQKLEETILKWGSCCFLQLFAAVAQWFSTLSTVQGIWCSKPETS